jgi:hypothetical protein
MTPLEAALSNAEMARDNVCCALLESFISRAVLAFLRRVFNLDKTA